MKPEDQEPTSTAPTERPKPAPKKSKFALKSRKTKMSEETAIEQLMLLLERYDIDIESEKDSKEKAVFEKEIEQILKYIMQGRLEVKMDAGELIVIQYPEHLSEGTTIPDKKIVYGELTGANQDTVPPGKDANQSAIVDHVMGLACKHVAGIEWIKGLKSSDKKVTYAVGALFLSR